MNDIEWFEREMEKHYLIEYDKKVTVKMILTSPNIYDMVITDSNGNIIGGNSK